MVLASCASLVQVTPLNAKIVRSMCEPCYYTALSQMVAPALKGLRSSLRDNILEAQEDGEGRATAKRSEADGSADSVQVRKFGGFVEGGYPFYVYMPP